MKKQLIFTVCAGRCGQVTLTKYFNKYIKNCIAECEPPELWYQTKWPLGSRLRNFQRKHMNSYSDEMLGRGKAIKWYEEDDDTNLDHLVGKRLKRIEKFKCLTYVEISKFFIRSYGEATIKKVPNLKLIKLSRNPITNARSFTNRNKNYALDGIFPHFHKSLLKMDVSKMSLFQLYLWQWAEIELRYLRLLEIYHPLTHYELSSESIDDPNELKRLFQHFQLNIKNIPITPLTRENTNVENGFQETMITESDLKSFQQFLEMSPYHLINKISGLKSYL